MSVTMPLRAGLTAVVVALLFAVLAAAAAPAGATSRCKGAGTYVSKKKARKALLCLVNRERREHGLQPLHRDRRLSRVARHHARDLVRFRFVGHTSPVRGTLMRRIRRSGWARGRARWTYGEIMGDGLNRGASPRRIVGWWMRRRIHSNAILDPAFRSMGVGATSGRPSGWGRAGVARTYVMTFAG